jgi:hypothetical protein
MLWDALDPKLKNFFYAMWLTQQIRMFINYRLFLNIIGAVMFTMHVPLAENTIINSDRKCNCAFYYKGAFLRWKLSSRTAYICQLGSTLLVKRINVLNFKKLLASRMMYWSKALHRNASCATRDPGSSPASVTAGHNRETHGAAHNWPSVVWVKGGFGRQGYSPISL